MVNVMSKEIERMCDVFNAGIEADADSLFDFDGNQIADFSGYKKQCRHVAHAVNCYDELVEALHFVHRYAADEPEYRSSPAFEQVQSIINKAKGESK